MLKSNKRGQVTIFIIISVLIVISVSLFFILRSDFITKNTNEINVDPAIQPIYNYVDNCVESSSREVIHTIGAGGGYYEIRPEVSTEVLGITYYIKDGKNIMPSKNIIANQISGNIETQLENCTSDLNKEFNDYYIKKKNSSVETKIKSEEVIIKVEYPILIRKEESRYDIKEFESRIPIKLGIMYDAIKEFVTKEINSNEGIDVSDMSEIASEYKLDFNIIQIDEKGDKFLFMVTESQKEINNKTFIYSFANEY
ncbi:MAG TPA: hypothetical protein VJ912_02430 [Candidatus Nanoarchaeia archaeon]|nr:hypothetical protein [Candidatus Nanoarchaeia archaeon]